MEEEQQDIEKQNNFRWKKKQKYDPHTCAIVGCKKPSQGFSPLVHKGHLTFRPICEECCVAACSHKPTPFHDLRMQRPYDNLLEVMGVEKEVLDELIAIDDRKEARGDYDRVQPESAPEETPPAVEQPVAQQAQQVALIPVAEIETWTKQGQDVLKALESFHITDQKGIDIAVDLLKDVKTLYDLIETRRKKTGKPMRDQIKVIQSKFKPPLELLLQAEALLKAKINNAYQAAQQAQMNALQAAQAAFQSGDMHGTALATQQAAQTNVELPSGTSQRTQLRWEVVDIQQVPPEYLRLVVNEAAVSAALANGVTNIPGLRVWEEKILSQRT